MYSLTIFSVYFQEVIQEQSLSPFGPVTYERGGSTRLVTNCDKGRGGAKIINLTVTSFLNGPIGDPQLSSHFHPGDAYSDYSLKSTHRIGICFKRMKKLKLLLWVKIIADSAGPRHVFVTH